MSHPFELKFKGNQKGQFPDIWITSDLHYNHKNICAGTTEWRNKKGEIPFESVRDFTVLSDMNETIISGINNHVGQDDYLILVGDVAFQGAESVHKLLDRIVCRNLILVYGNHDENIAENEMSLQNRFIKRYTYLKLHIGKHRFIIQHYPIVSWHGLNKGSMHLFGHVHLRTKMRFGPGRCMDIGFDGHPENRPYHIINECVPLLEKRPIKSWFTHDHHVEDFA